jgi:LssY-like putative type I secretion system component LssY
MVLHDVIVALAVLLLVLGVLGWRRGRRLQALFDSVRDLNVGALTGYRHGRLEEVPLAGRALTQRDDGVAVTVAVLSAKESRALFGTDLARSGIQPVWLEVKNDEAVPYWLLTAGLDANYFSAREAAWVRHTRLARSANRQMDEFFDQVQLRNPILPGTTGAGFVFSNLDEHTKPVSVDLIAPRHGLAKSFTFFAPIPGLKTDFSRIDLDRLYPPEAMVRLQSEAELRSAVEQLPGFTTNKRGTARGDPLNLVLIGKRDDVFPAFLRRGWHPTESIYLGSSWKTLKSFVLGSRYRYSPVSPLYALGRFQDLAGQKARQSISQRNHIRMWLTPLEYQGRSVWLGQISRDIGVRWTLKTWNLTTHKIDPDVDEARLGLIQDLLYSQSVIKFGFARGVETAPESRPHHNLTGDPFFTDGLRAVLVFERRPVALDQIEVFEWERPAAASASPLSAVRLASST